MRKAWALAAFVAVIIAANWVTMAYGLTSVLGVTVTAGTWLAGFGFVARDALQESGGSRWVLAAVAIGAALSGLFSPALALASAVAFAMSELADWSVYTPLRKRGKTGAAIASNAVGAVVDSALFLALAGFPLSGVPSQTAIKVATTTVFVLGVRLALSRQPVWAGSSGSDA